MCTLPKHKQPLGFLCGLLGRKRVVVRCCLVTAVKPVGLKSTGAARERNGSEPPNRRCLFGRCGGCLQLFSPPNTITSYGDRTVKVALEESNSRSNKALI